jgi:hypothetical protein
MDLQQTLILQPFLEIGRSSPGVSDLVPYRAGYRCAQTGNVICWVELPRELVESVVMSSLALSAVVTPDGQIETSVERVKPRPSEPTPLVLVQPIDALIVRTLTSNNLHLEEAGETELAQLRDRLERSLALVSERIQKTASAGRK